MDDFNLTYYNNMKDVSMANEVISICAINATRKTQGVAQLYGTVSETVSKKLFKRDSITRGAKVAQTPKGVVIDVFVVVDFGMKIPAVAWEIQANVKKEVELITEKEVKTVNVHVQGVDLPRQ